MAREAILIIGGDVARKRFVGIVAGHAGNACVACGPALAVFKTIGGEADVLDAGVDHRTGDDVLPSAMTGTTEIHGIYAAKLSGIED